jgi:hypothetical protein
MNARTIIPTFVFVASLICPLSCRGTEPVWHEQNEHNLNWCHLSASQLVLKGNTICDGQTQVTTMAIELAQLPEADIKKALLGKAKLYGLAGGGKIQEVTDTVIKDVVITIGERVLRVPPSALQGILNPLTPSGVRLESADGGYVTLTLLGSAGERAYTCCFIFRNWQFDLRQVTKDGGQTVDNLRPNK